MAATALYPCGCSITTSMGHNPVVLSVRVCDKHREVVSHLFEQLADGIRDAALNDQTNREHPEGPTP